MTKHAFLLIASLLGLALRQASALENVTGITTTFIPGVPSLVEGYTFQNAQSPITGLSTAVSNYAVLGIADNVFVRRNDVSPNQSSVWYAGSGNGTNLAGVHYDDYGQMLLGNNINGGSDNTFSNAGTGPSTGNIERLDFTWNAPLTVSNALAFAIFDRGVTGVHDSFAIAAITAIDSLGNPTAFGSLLRVSAGWGGTSNPTADITYRLFRYNNGDIITAATETTEANTQGIGGIVITPMDLGLVAGTQIFGYSLMAIDVTATTSAELLDWTNISFFPTDTDGATGGGGIDLASLNGIAFVAVPEPTTWGLLVIGGALAGCWSVRRKQQARG